jgi:hypothetical protein
MLGMQAMNPLSQAALVTFGDVVLLFAQAGMDAILC